MSMSERLAELYADGTGWPCEVVPGLVEFGWRSPA